jgi:hypothetical protein
MAGFVVQSRGRWRFRRGRHWPSVALLTGAVVLAAALAGTPAAQASQSGAVTQAVRASQPRPAIMPRRPAALPRLAGRFGGRPVLWRPQSLRFGPWQPPAAGLPGHAASPWRVEPTPNPGRVRNGTLLSDSCTARTACTAVGSSFNGAGTTVTLAARWNGAMWRAQPTPDPAGALWSELLGVSCTAARACIAVGYYYNSAGHVLTLAERWNGTAWRIQATPNPAGSPASGLFAVSCTSARACTAAGETTASSGASQVLAETRNGSRWRIVTAPSPAGAEDSALFGVSCSAPAGCAAVGAYLSSSGATLTLAERWNGTRWRIRSTPAPAGTTDAGLNAVSCTSPGACTAVGEYFTSGGTALTLAERWNGRRWRIQATPNPAGPAVGSGSGGSELLSVWCSAARACTAVGAFVKARTTVTLAEAWNGTSWRVQATPNPAGSLGSGLAGVSCPSPGACTAAGSWQPSGTFAGVPLAEAWNATRWRIEHAPSRRGAAAADLLAVSCPAARACTAVGGTSNRAGLGVPLAESWNGAHWRSQLIPSPAGATEGSTLFAVSCTSPGACMATGYYNASHDRSASFAESWNGTRWSVLAIPSPARATNSQLSSVSCTSARACTAIGSFSRGSRLPRMLAERWNGTGWRRQAVPTPAGRQSPQLSGVSCTTARACTAAGFDTNKGGQGQPLAEAWNGASWAVQPTPLPAGADGGILSAVSCTSPATCTATGSLFAVPGAPMSDNWNGTTWRIRSAPNPPGYTTSTSLVLLAGVSCKSADECIAIGNYTPNNEPETFAEAWNGTRWALQATAIPPGTIADVLAGVSCAGASCTAVGTWAGLTGIGLTLAISTSA